MASPASRTLKTTTRSTRDPHGAAAGCAAEMKNSFSARPGSIEDVRQPEAAAAQGAACRTRGNRLYSRRAKTLWYQSRRNLQGGPASLRTNIGNPSSSGGSKLALSELQGCRQWRVRIFKPLRAKINRFGMGVWLIWFSRTNLSSVAGAARSEDKPCF